MDKDITTGNGRAVSFPANIMQALEAGGICYSYDRRGNMVRVCYSGVYGDIFSLYSTLAEEGLVNFTIYPFVVPAGHRERVEACLWAINRESPFVCFYIDSQTNCIAFSSEYFYAKDGKDGYNTTDQDILQFCLDVHLACIGYQEALYRLLMPDTG